MMTENSISSSLQKEKIYIGKMGNVGREEDILLFVKNLIHQN